MKKVLIVVITTMSAVFAAGANPITFDLKLNTSQAAVTGDPYQLEFLLTGNADDSVSVSNINFGTGGSGSSTPLSITEANGDQILGFTPGSLLSFTLSSADHGPANSSLTPDELSILFEDTNFNPVTTTQSGPNSNDALLTLTLTGGADTPQLFTGTEAPLLGIGFTTGAPITTPEPATLPLITAAALLALAAGIFRRHALCSNRHSISR